MKFNGPLSHFRLSKLHYISDYDWCCDQRKTAKTWYADLSCDSYLCLQSSSKYQVIGFQSRKILFLIAIFSKPETWYQHIYLNMILLRFRCFFLGKMRKKFILWLKILRPVHEILLLIGYAQKAFFKCPSWCSQRARGEFFGPAHPLLSYLVYVRSESSGAEVIKLS